MQNPSSSPTAIAPETRATAYRSESALSRKLYEQAGAVMPGGNTRHSTVLAPYPVYVASGSGCCVTAVEGQERIDFLNNYTSLILGHANPQLSQAAPRRMARCAACPLP